MNRYLLSQKLNVFIFLILAFVLASCNMDKSKPNYRFFPQMYDPVGYETYQESEVFLDGTEAMLPPEGVIKRGWTSYPFENSTEAYNLSKTELKNPFSENETNLKKGAELYGIYCAVCHGKKGDGQGILVKREKYLGVPNYKDRDITQGSIYHVMFYGLNAMGSYASQLEEKERWQVVMYVEQLRNNLTK